MELALDIAAADLGKNAQQILQLLRTRGPLSGSDLSRLSGLGKATISRLVTRLRAIGLVEETGAAIQHGGPGRAGKALRIRPESELYIGLHIRSGGIETVLTDAARQVVGQASFQHDHRAARGDQVALLAAACRSAIANADRNIACLRGVGIAIPAPIHPLTHEVGPAVRLPEWSGADFSGALAEILGVPVVVENDSNCAAMAEIALGGQQHGQTFAYIHLDRGVGGALVLEGALWPGFTGRAGNFGHLPYDPYGERCRCGGRGCFEKYLSLPALLARIEPETGPIDLAQLVSRLNRGDPAVTRAVRATGEILGTLMANLSRSIDPPVFVLGGHASRIGAVLVDAARARLAMLNPSAGQVRSSSFDGPRAEIATALGAVLLLIAGAPAYARR